MRGIAAPTLAALALISAGAWAVPDTRAAIENAAGGVATVFDGWRGGDPASAPGRPIRTGEAAPAYFDAGSWSRRHVREPRVIAEAGGYELYAYRERNGSIGFDLGDTGVGMGGFTPADFRRSTLHLLGPGAMATPDDDGQVPWFGIAAQSVTSVELLYRSGPPLRLEDVKGAFVLLVRPDRGPRDVIALDAEGRVVGRRSIAFAYEPKG
jgi:hypothetical protein